MMKLDSRRTTVEQDDTAMRRESYVEPEKDDCADANA